MPHVIELEPVDRVCVTILMDNVTDPLLADQGPVTRLSWPKALTSGVPRVATPLAPEGVPDALVAEPGFSALVRVEKSGRHLYRERGDDPSAARAAAWLAGACLEFRGEPAVANGWLQRAHSILDDLEPGPDHSWLAIRRPTCAHCPDEKEGGAEEHALVVEPTGHHKRRDEHRDQRDEQPAPTMPSSGSTVFVNQA